MQSGRGCAEDIVIMEALRLERADRRGIMLTFDDMSRSRSSRRDIFVRQGWPLSPAIAYARMGPQDQPLSQERPRMTIKANYCAQCVSVLRTTGHWPAHA